jgi:hypothetical protein
MPAKLSAILKKERIFPSAKVARRMREVAGASTPATSGER